MQRTQSHEKRGSALWVAYILIMATNAVAVRCLRQIAKKAPSSRKEIATIYDKLLRQDRNYYIMGYNPYVSSGQMIVDLIDAIVELGSEGKIASPS